MIKSITRLLFSLLFLFAFCSSAFAQKIVSRTGNPVQKTVVSMSQFNSLPQALQQIIRDNPQKFTIQKQLNASPDATEVADPGLQNKNEGVSTRKIVPILPKNEDAPDNSDN